MKLKKAIFVSSTEAPGRHDKVAFLQSSDPERRDCYVPDLWLGELGVMAGDDVYPLHMFRRLTVDSIAIEADNSPAGAINREYAELEKRTLRDCGLEMVNIVKESRKRRGRPPKSRE